MSEAHDASGSVDLNLLRVDLTKKLRRKAGASISEDIQAGAPAIDPSKVSK